MVSARGLWDRLCAPGSVDAVVRAYQRTVPCLIAVDSGGKQAEPGLSTDQVREIVERCLRFGPPISVPFFVETFSRRSAEALMRDVGSLLRERCPGCKVVLRVEEASRQGLFPVVEPDAWEEDPDAAEADPWAWRIPIATLIDPAFGPEIAVAAAAELQPRRVLIDSVDLLATVAGARHFPPRREEELLARIVSRLPAIDVWRASDLLEGEFLAYHARLPLS